MDVILLALTATILVFLLLRHYSHRRPPGPWGLPLVGYAPFLGSDPHRRLAALGKRYGRVFQYSFGSHAVLVLDDFDAIKMAYLDQADTFAGRAPLYLQQVMSDGLGLIAPEGPPQVEHRRFALSTLRHLRNAVRLDELVADEGHYLAECFLAQSGRTWAPHDAIALSVSNVICSLTFGRRFGHDDARFRSLVGSLNRVFCIVGQSRALLLLPLLRFLPPWRGRFATLQVFLQNLRQLIDDVISEHHESEGHMATVRDYIDAFAHRQHQEAHNEKSTFTRDQLYQSINSLFSAGTETTSTTLLWAVLLMMHYPQAQRRVQDELDRVVGRSRAVTLSDRAQLPLTEATIMEIARWASVAPLGLPRRTMRATTLDGYYVEKGTYVMPNIWSCHRDVKYFPNPNEFKPERFITSRGGLMKNAALVPFSIGKRSCLAESLAHAELFVFFSNIVHRVRLDAPEDEALPSPFTSIYGLTLHPPPYKCRPIKRE